MSSAFSGILAYGFFHMNGLGDLGPKYGQHYGPTKLHPAAPSGIMSGMAGWRWIFIMQGIITVVVGAIGAFTIVDFPELAAKRTKTSLPFLNEREVAFVCARIEKDRHDVVLEPFNLGRYLRGACDLKILGFGAIFGLTTTVTYAIAYFLPIILNVGMGFSVGASQCLIGKFFSSSLLLAAHQRSPLTDTTQPHPTSSPPSSCTAAPGSATNGTCAGPL
jgi:hypothetical protein